MSFIQAACVILFIVGLCIASFIFGIAISNRYHQMAERRVQKSIASYHETMKENYALSEGQRHWNAYYLPARDAPLTENDCQRTIRRINS